MPGVTGSRALGLAPEVDEFRRQFEEISASADRLVSPLTDTQFHWQPSPQSWSVGQCLEHLNATARVYLPSLDEGIASAIRRGQYAEGPFAYNWIGRLFVRIVEPPPRVRAKAPAAMQPAARRLRSEVTAAFHAYQVQYIDRLRQASGVDLASARVASPVSRWIRIPLGSAFALMCAHERRHLWQARRVTEAPGFPR
jgi:hypothetical protein